MQIDRSLIPLVRSVAAPFPVLALALAAMLASGAADAQRRERSGVEVVESVCAACHGEGKNGAPRIGDATAWAPRASQGLTALTANALRGIRNMPAHGGNASVSDIEIERAITHMVNQSGGHWIEPLDGATPAVVRSGERIVQSHCARCHQEGLDGAPRIGDRAAWIPRLRKGLDAAVKSAVHGHGAMPARGGVADLSDQEINGAVVYMFNYGVPVPPPAPVAAAPATPYHKVVAGTDVYLGIVPAQALRAAGQVAPRGKDFYHLNISLFDVATKAAITDAKVTLKVADPMGEQTRALDPISANNVTSYGGYFRMSEPTPYTITAQIQRPGSTRVNEAKFEYRVR